MDTKNLREQERIAEANARPFGFGIFYILVPPLVIAMALLFEAYNQ